VLGVRHQPEHVARRVRDAGDVARRAVEVVPGRVAQRDLAVGLELVEHRIGRPVAAGRVLARDRQRIPDPPQPRGPRVRHLQLDLPADEAQRDVREQRAGQQPRLAEHLEAVADPEHQPAVAREALDLGHHRGEARDRPDPEVVAVGEAARDDDRVDPAQIGVGVPEELRLTHPAGGEQRIDVVAGAGEANDAELHDPMIS
jgi:hypothetical protein